VQRVAEAIRGRRREKLFLVSKVLPENASRRGTIAACEASLRRLGTDYIDLYQIHRFDYETPIEETLEALNDCVRAGKYGPCQAPLPYSTATAIVVSVAVNGERNSFRCRLTPLRSPCSASRRTTWPSTKLPPFSDFLIFCTKSAGRRLVRPGRSRSPFPTAYSLLVRLRHAQIAIDRILRGLILLARYVLLAKAFRSRR
jgi:hypothetical protein